MEGEPAAAVFSANQERNQTNGRFALRGTQDQIRAEAERLAAGDAVSHARTLADKQQALAARLTSEFNAKILYKAQTAVNGIAVLALPDQVPALGKLPGVVRVIEIDLVKESAVSSVNFVGTRNFWNPATLDAQGDGVGVCVIDSGIDFVHTAMGGPGGAQGYDLNATSIAGGTPATTFPTSKVVWGYDLAGDNYNAGGAGAALTPVPDPNPMCVGPASFSGAQGHGAACASLIAGFGVNADGTTYSGSYNATQPDISALRVSPGIAPLAKLYAVRVFGNAGSSGLVGQALDITTALRIWQLSPNGTPLPPAIATLTGAAAPPRTPVVSVVSLSLGSSNGYYTPFDSSSVAAQNAALSGMSVIISAGNAYDSHYIVGSPSVATATISVAATYNQQLPGASATAPAQASPPLPALSTGMLLGTAAVGITVQPNVLAATDIIYSKDPLGDFQHTAGTTNAAILTCALRNDQMQPVSDANGNPLTPSGGNPYTGKIVLIDRGGVGFHQKALAAARAGAAACVIVNNRPGAAPGMAAATGTPPIPVVNIPVVSINQDDGALLTMTGAPNLPPTRTGAQLALVPENPAGADIIADYSSRGPRRFDNVLKPDMAAPAENVTVLQAGTGNQVMSFNGTSSACPHVAGSMALLRELTNSAGPNPAWTMEELKALMLNMNQFNPATAGNLYGLGRIGGGRLTLNPSGGVPTAVMYSTDPDFPVSVSFGSVDVPVDGTRTVSKTVRISNKAPFSRQFMPTVNAINSVPGVVYEVIGDSGVGTAINVAGNSTKDFTVRLSATGSAMRHVRDVTVSAQQVFAINAPPVTPVALLPRATLTEFGAQLELNEMGLIANPEGITSNNKLHLALHSLPRPVSSLSVTPATVTLPAATATQNFTFAGTGISTGANTSLIANRVADIQSHAKMFELQYRKTSTEVDPYFVRAEVREVGVTSDFARRGNPFDTATTNNQSLVLTFAVTTHGDFNTPSASDVDIRILIDTNGDGTENFTLRSFAWNDPSYGTGTNGSNMFLCVTNPTGSTTLTTTGFITNVLNGVPSNILNNNVTMLSVNAQRLGLTVATSRFLYKVQTFWRGSLESETPWIAYDCARPGIDASGPASVNEPFLFNANNGGSVTVSANGPNFAANRSIGALAVFPHNAAGNRSQVILAGNAARLFISSFSPTSGPVGTSVTITGSGFTGASAVSFGGINAPGFVVNSDTQITVNVPAGAQSGTVKVTTGAGVATSRARFTVN